MHNTVDGSAICNGPLSQFMINRTFQIIQDQMNRLSPYLHTFTWGQKTMSG